MPCTPSWRNFRGSPDLSASFSSLLKIVFAHYGLEIRLSLLNPRLVHFEVKEQTAKLIATHNVLPGLGLLKYSHHRLLKKT